MKCQFVSRWELKSQSRAVPWLTTSFGAQRVSNHHWRHISVGKTNFGFLSNMPRVPSEVSAAAGRSLGDVICVLEVSAPCD